VGSPDIFGPQRNNPFGSINFVTCHDGFSLQDLVTYSQKHNEANGEQNRDGSDHNLSWNCGIEGPTDDPVVNKLRNRQVRNFLTLLMLSHGTPMLWMGDETGHTRLGNNNPWCQDNDLNWFNWDRARDNAALVEFTRNLIRFSAGLEILQENRYWKATDNAATGDISWHGTQAGRPDWTPGSHALAFTLEQPASGRNVHVMLNAGSGDLTFEAPPAPAGLSWHRIIDTAAPTPANKTAPAPPSPLGPGRLPVAGHSITVLQCLDNTLK